MDDTNKIGKENIEDIMDLTDTQKGMLYHYIKDSETKEYQEQTCITITGEIDIEILKKAWNHIIETNEMLRTIYRWDKLDKPVQIVLKDYEIPFKFFDLCKESCEVKDELFKGILENHKNENINIKNESIKITMCKIEEYKYKMIIKNHHIIYDGWSNGIILREFVEAYNCYFEGKEPIKQVKNKFKQLVKWNKQQDKNIQREYWEGYLKDFEHESNIFNSSNTSKVNKHIGEHTYVISDLIKQKLEASAKKLQVSVAAILYSVWAILQQRYENSEDIIFGMTVSGRTAKVKDIDNIVGMFINTIPLRVKKHSSQEACKLIKSVEESLRAHEEFENTALLDIKSYGKYNHEKSLFDNIVVIENYPLDIVADKNSKIKIEDCFISETTNFNMTFGINIFDNLEIKVSYNKESFEDEFIIRMTKHYENILNEILSNAYINISEIEMISEEEKHKLLYDFNDTYADYPRDKTLHELFEEQAQKTPDNVAVVFEDKTLTYRELNERANRLARTLRGKGVKADSIVGIMVERSTYMIVAIMGVLKAGGAYLPIDLEYPEARITYMLEDSKTNIILTQSRFKENVVFNGEIIDLECKSTYAENRENIENINTSKNLAYVIYTSGSTGKPKGVMIEHKNVINTLTWFVNKYRINDQKSVMNLTEYTFDPSVEQIFGTLISGAKLYIPKKEEILDKNKFATYVASNKINVVNFVPAMIKELLLNNIKFNTVDTVIIGGERLEDNVKDKLIKLGYKVFNHYGPTETTIDALAASCKEGEKVTLGKPIQNTEVYILGRENNMMPIGVCGELYISGEGLARGYLNRPELTLERFLENPFDAKNKMYKTGDAARWLPDGNIEFIGRIDHQVKIRGFRIELGEIECQLLDHESVKEAIVLDRENENGSKYLCAYLVSEKELIVGKLREYLSKKLPEHMVPSYFVQLDKMPLIPNGKIDRKALPKPDGSIVTGAEYEAARNKIEEKLIKIWSDVLGVERLGINDNFFELGGHSLKATTLVSKIHKELSVAVPLREVFKSPTIKGISEYIESTEESIYSSIERVEEKEYYEASSAQKRMYMLQQFDLKSTGYNMPGLMVIEGRLDAERLEKSFAELIRRHETLRTYFETIEDKIVQRVSESMNFKLDYFEVGCIEDIEVIEDIDKAVDNIVNGFVKAFDLNKAPLLRAGIIKLKEEKHILLFDMHHIISDGVSMGILTSELARIYEGNELEQLRIQYKDYSEWQNSMLKSEEMENQKEYWIDRFSNEVPVLNMPTDFQRPLMQSFEGENISFKLDKELTKNLNKIGRETGSTMYMVLLSGVNILLSKYSGQEDIIIGSPIAGRPHADLLKVIGMFVNTLAMRNYPEGSRTYEEFLKEVKENALKVYENQDYQFDELVDRLSITRDISRNPLFDVMFTMQNMDVEEIKLKDLVLKEYKQENKVAKFDLTFSASELGDEIIFELEYSKKLYKRETIERMVEHFVSILKAVCTDTKIKLSKIDMLTEQEKHKLLYEFNDTYSDYSRDKTIHELFEEQVEKTPDNVSVVFEDEKLTYKELNEKSNRLARTLREKGVKPDSIVGIMVERSLDMIVGIMGILKAGGAYLPIDLEYPKDRIDYMLLHSKTDILLIQGKIIGELSFHGEFINLKDERAYCNCSDNLENISTSKDLAYVIYTSGSTGKPKGVMIEQRSVVNLCNWCSKKYNIAVNKNALQMTNISFDVSVEETIGVILSGGTIYIPNKEIIFDKVKFKNYVNENKINLVQFVPATLNELIAENDFMESLSVIICGGDKLDNTLKNKVISRGYNLFNNYGPTEITVDAISTKCNESNVIGKPIDNTQIYISNSAGLLQPIGIAGEIYVSGEGVARGYLNSPEFTAEKFIDNPFIEAQKMYKTGDLGAWTPDGNIEFLGRIDHQVKIRGFRIELGEIESQLLNHESVKEAIVLDREDENGSKYLCAYIVSEKDLTIGELRKNLANSLPKYMVPSYFVQLGEMPLTPNGKIDRKSLPEPDGSIVTGTEYEAPRNAVEEKLVEIWRQILGVQQVGINDNFFELGGHSLKAIQVISLIHKKLNTKISLASYFKTPTISSLCEIIKKSQNYMQDEIKALPRQSYYDISYAQNRLWIINQLQPSSLAYNMPGYITLHEEVDANIVKRVFEELIHRHESLRTRFKVVDEKVVQIIEDKVNLQIDTIDISEVNNNEQDEKRKQIVSVQASIIFNLEEGPLISIKLVKIKAEEYDLVFCMHHIISDGWSMEILKNEFFLFYNAFKEDKEFNLQSLNVQYRDYAAWQNELIRDKDRIKLVKDYWHTQLSGEIPVMKLPVSYYNSELVNKNSAGYRIVIPQSQKNGLKALAIEYNTSIFVVLIATFNLLLADLTGQKDILIGTPGFGRDHEDFKSIIGYFVNTIIIRNQINYEESFIDLLKKVNDNTLKALEYQNFPIELIADELKIDYPKISVFFNMLNIGDSSNEYIENFNQYHIEKVQDAKFDMVWYVTEYANGIQIMCDYLLGIFEPSRIEYILARYMKLVEAILEKPNNVLKEYNIDNKKRKKLKNI